MRISFWSTPRTVSTACLRAFAGRKDCVGVDEPFYAWYLSQTGKQHPMREEVLASQDADWRKVIEDELVSPISLKYQFVKHMSHHMVGDIDFSWLQESDQRCVFLIRDPQEQLPSMERDLGEISMADVGWEMHWRIFSQIENPLVVDAKDLLVNPRGILKKLCECLGMTFEESMLTWQQGRHESYGVWAPFWYKSLEASNGFIPWKEKQGELSSHLIPLYKECNLLYQKMYAVRLMA